MKNEFSDNLIEAKNISLLFDEDEGAKVEALKNVSISIKRGSFVAIVGGNGSGKSTLAKCMNALLIPTDGEMIVNGYNSKNEDSIWEIRKTVGMVFQNPDNQLVSSVVEDDVAFGPENLGIAPDEIRKRVDSALKAVGMYELRKKGPHLLSGGQKQRVAIAGVLAMESEGIVFDESSSMLDPEGRRELMEIIEKLKDEGKTIILITHFMEEAVMADRIVVMKDGEIAGDGTPVQIFGNDKLVSDCKIKLPFAVEMANELRNLGMNIPRDIIKENDLIDYIANEH